MEEETKRQELLNVLAKAEQDVKQGRVALLQGTFNKIRQELLGADHGRTEENIRI